MHFSLAIFTIAIVGVVTHFLMCVDDDVRSTHVQTHSAKIGQFKMYSV